MGETQLPDEREFEDLIRDVYASGGSLGEKLGIRFTEISAQRLVATMPVEGNTQPAGLLHGGASAALAETLGSVGAAVHAGPGSLVLGVDINATHHRSARSGLVTGIATPLFLGRSMATYEIVITDEAQRRICTARISCLIRKP
ncbi:hotdog fold thioesterase [Actinocrinis puniceicyclus]|uniref:Hotdog fold thioesterase n=1 Tax=Actinocrinis puniceicyclus TaxID=977794 RepID=A0A8J7WM55_9ACTN|nr:hotdog fold thioesterase [Actinocrinis puniceicyclus]MBS2962682.1 hotdog fold thioesterase [Actinocrinis puniceicyclus]